MRRISDSNWKRLLAAVEILHSHGHGELHQRLFKSARLLFADSVHSFEMYRRSDGQHTAQTDVPFSERNFLQIVSRIGELVPLENPIFPFLVRGETSPLRLSDLLSEREFHRTNLYHDVFKDVELRYQMVIPTSTETHAGALTINRGTRDYSDDDLALAVHFARHVAIAHETDRLLNQKAEIQPKQEKVDFNALQKFKLSQRECEVLWWISQAKRDREVAVILGISLRTVNHHVASILRKMGVESRASAIAMHYQLCGQQ